MDINTFRGLATVFALIGFISICIWAYSKKRKKDFDDAANLPFADDKQSSDGESL
ncbi:cbb3-type cytochrome c oxidase subunit 3 [Dasania sp. GY-MA-18]|uniref:Cbb3-type cytochrome c oxidase subunit 3 n=1 Tax=Dasania phycosphaerae TaxID=2950436 RepID=A0A9J6RNL7_9GAMM|nr:MULTISPECIES: cbb3-type cytochrome c oxidase subunit 3 [Dasania]MCR8923658.1 cbb3-type cytochrome c oxidase subunit 3 [Dasania sp. GY-MA-18]MCZ0866092.1 cbb3-type cytochrome c oxidase subunit 3 [Dasania phycosphaerae]MCZ0869816.1 cbb3-type cytochrome c oxidase subunit 3 [Dasania phycosphaerae]